MSFLNGKPQEHGARSNASVAQVNRAEETSAKASPTPVNALTFSGPVTHRTGPKPRFDRDDRLSAYDGSFVVTHGTKVATDRLGSRLAYRRGGAVASNPARLVERGHPMDPTALCSLLTFGHIPSTRTLFEGVQRLPPGTWFDLATGASSRYWQFPDDEPADADPRDLAGAEDVAVERAISNARTPILLLLSGGVDSRAMWRRARERGVPLEAVTFGPDTAGDVIAARRLTSGAAVKHHVIGVDFRDAVTAMVEWANVVADPSENTFATLPMGPRPLQDLPAGGLWLGTHGWEPHVVAAAPDDVESLPWWIAQRVVANKIVSLTPLLKANMLDDLRGPATQAVEEILAVAAPRGDESLGACLERVSLENRFVLWNINRALMASVRSVVTPFHDVDLVELHRRLPVEWRAERRAHLAANPDRPEEPPARSYGVTVDYVAALGDPRLQQQLVELVLGERRILAHFRPAFVRALPAVDQLEARLLLLRLGLAAAALFSTRGT